MSDDRPRGAISADLKVAFPRTGRPLCLGAKEANGRFEVDLASLPPHEDPA